MKICCSFAYNNWVLVSPSKCLFTSIRPKDPLNEITWNAKLEDTHMIRLNPSSSLDWPWPHSLFGISDKQILLFQFSYKGCAFRYWICINRINTLASESICLCLGRVYCLFRWITKCSESSADLFPFYRFGYSFANFCIIPYYFSSPLTDPFVFFIAIWTRLAFSTPVSIFDVYSNDMSIFVHDMYLFWLNVKHSFVVARLDLINLGFDGIFIGYIISAQHEIRSVNATFFYPVFLWLTFCIHIPLSHTWIRIYPSFRRAATTELTVISNTSCENTVPDTDTLIIIASEKPEQEREKSR